MRSANVFNALCCGIWLTASTANAFNDQKYLGQDTRPNVVFVLTDDQDLLMNSLDYMPFVEKHLTRQGTSFQRHFCTISICCPSRASLLTGMAAHNTNVTDIFPPYGGYTKFAKEGWNDNYLPLWLQNAGYNTYYVGKLFNDLTVNNYNKPYSRGWTGSELLLDPHTYRYMNPAFSRNHEPPKIYHGQYSTDLIRDKSFGFLDDAVKADKPFFLTIAPVAPHNNVQGGRDTKPIPAPRHRGLFKDVKIPRTKNFNPEQPSGASWVKELPRLNARQVENMDEWHRDRLRSLQAVDELVDKIVAKLIGYNLLSNTYIFFTTDNGFHIAQHRFKPGKTCGYEEDIRIPLIVRGPGVPKGVSSQIVTSHTDMAATFFDILGIPQRDEFDGSPIPLTEAALAAPEKTKREHVNIEFWSLRTPATQSIPGLSPVPGLPTIQSYPANNTYKSVRVMGRGYNLYYSVWCTNEHELYDLEDDPHQMTNLFSHGFTGPPPTTSKQILGYPIRKIASRLDGLMMVLKSCRGDTCRDPWKTLMPDTGVFTLKEALQAKHDGFFANQISKVRYDRCEPGYIVDAEGPMFEDLGRWMGGREEGGDPAWAMMI